MVRQILYGAKTNGIVRFLVYISLNLWDVIIKIMDEDDNDLVTVLLNSKSKIWEDKKRLGLLGETQVSCFQDFVNYVPKWEQFLQFWVESYYTK